MAAGIQPTKEDISLAVGSALLNVKKSLDNVVALKAYLDPIGGAGLEAKGFSDRPPCVTSPDLHLHWYSVKVRAAFRGASRVPAMEWAAQGSNL